MTIKTVLVPGAPWPEVGEWPPARVTPPPKVTSTVVRIVPRPAPEPADPKIMERVVATATRCIGYQYQHHHVPDWDPPESWPWKECCGERHAKGIDCSNFSGWNYNWALGIHLNTDVHKQAALTMAATLFSEPYLSTSAKHQGLILHSVYHRPNGWDYITPGQRVPNGESSMWGDYHARELALLLLREARGEHYLTFFDTSAT